MVVSNDVYDRSDADRQALVESLMSALGLSEAEAKDRLDNEDWRGLNSTEAVREAADEEADEPATSTGPLGSVMSIPYDEDEGGMDTVEQTGVPQGVTAPQIVVDPEAVKEAEEAKEAADDAADDAAKQAAADDKAARKSAAKDAADK